MKTQKHGIPSRVAYLIAYTANQVSRHKPSVRSTNARNATIMCLTHMKTGSDKIPSAETVFVCGNSDISFCDPDFTRRIINAIKTRNVRRPDKTYFFQSKKPKYFEQFLEDFPENVILLTTLETNRDEGYS